MMNEKSDILLINRDKDFLEEICDQIRQAGHTVHTAMDMREALTAMISKPIGLIWTRRMRSRIFGESAAVAGRSLYSVIFG